MFHLVECMTSCFLQFMTSVLEATVSYVKSLRQQFDEVRVSTNQFAIIPLLSKYQCLFSFRNFERFRSYLLTCKEKFIRDFQDQSNTTCR